MKINGDGGRGQWWRVEGEIELLDLVFLNGFRTLDTVLVWLVVIDGWMVGWMDDEWMDGWMNRWIRSALIMDSSSVGLGGKK